MGFDPVPRGPTTCEIVAERQLHLSGAVVTLLEAPLPCNGALSEIQKQLPHGLVEDLQLCTVCSALKGFEAAHERQPLEGVQALENFDERGNGFKV
jgi:hypothetical protein